ncbi:amidase signature domain-containing protein [Hypoxylon argillaceum]|nr:amidase signature domain-containing protein [Hypoxylon argillaceum]
MEDLRFSCEDSDFSIFKQPIAYIDCPSVTQGGYSLLPVTALFVEPGQKIDSAWLEKERERILRCDDVSNDSFFKHCIICYNGGDILPSQEPSIGSNSLSNCYVCNAWKPVQAGSCVRSGPYVLRDSALYQVYRLYDDPYEAFVFGVIEDSNASPHSFHKYRGGQIPVPSRLYSEPASTSRPLEGKRVAIKDIFDLAGVPTGVSSRDYQAFSGNAKRSANMITRLIDAGAIIVGKTKTTQFASGEHPRDWIDYQCPFNPRGDGYLDPELSSTGSAVAIAAYEWLDYSVGSDTLGSMTGPAASQGIFGIRPTHGISDLNGVLPVSAPLDTAGFFARSITDSGLFGHLWYGNGATRSQGFGRLLYASSEFDQYPNDIRSTMDSFVNDIARVMGQPQIPLDVATLWDEKEAPAVKKPINEFLSTTLAHIQLFDSYHNNLKFREEFRKNKGREPYLNPMVRFKWDLGSRLTLEQYERAREEQENYRNFLRNHVFSENTILVLPAGSPKSRYRDAYDGPPSQSGYSLQGFGFLRDMYSFLGGLPQLVIPSMIYSIKYEERHEANPSLFEQVGAVSRQSPVTGGMVEEPISISIVGAPGMDCALMDFAERALKESGRPMAVLTGSSLFGQN